MPAAEATAAPAAKAATAMPAAVATAAPAAKASTVIPAAKVAGVAKTAMVFPMFGLLALGGVIAFEIWQGSKDAHEIKEKK
ncbi:MAG: hypothetical protein HQK69_05915 [Desulfamplus sp.]|nr:hypothetical protein [Desulfamplus sp.]